MIPSLSPPPLTAEQLIARLEQIAEALIGRANAEFYPSVAELFRADAALIRQAKARFIAALARVQEPTEPPKSYEASFQRDGIEMVKRDLLVLLNGGAQ